MNKCRRRWLTKSALKWPNPSPRTGDLQVTARGRFKDGSKPKSPGRRTFMKTMAGLASLPFVGKLFKPAAKVADAAPVIQEGAKLGFENFMLLVDKIKRLGIIRGKMRKRNWVNMGSIVLYSIREYEKDKVDIIHVYSNSVLKMLEHKMNLNFNISNDNNDDEDIFTTNDTYEEQFVENIPEKQKTTNQYYNFSDSSEEENEIEYDNDIVDDQFIDDL